jgi:SAM-dependent methyltransferase
MIEPMLFFVRMLRRGRGPAMDPLHVSMTGVRMGERFLQIGCSDRALLAGLAAKVGLSGTAAVAAYDASQAKLAQSIGASVGALIEIKNIAEGREWPFGDTEFDMVVVDDTDDSFWGYEPPVGILRKAWRTLRPGGRIEVITPVESQHGKFNFLDLLSEAGFKPVRILAERGRLRFVEGLRTEPLNP